MPSTDAFALANSGLNAFLFAEVGTELNGSPLTVLSVLGRLGKDPWLEARRWADLPKAPMIDAIVSSITQMPLNPQALVDARQTATRLILLLPAADAGAAFTHKLDRVVAVPHTLTVVLLISVAALGLAVSGTWLQPPSSTAKTPVVSSITPQK